jgi:hypothetical protein
MARPPTFKSASMNFRTAASMYLCNSISMSLMPPMS